MESPRLRVESGALVRVRSNEHIYSLFRRCTKILRGLRVGLGSAVGKAQDPEQGLDCQALCQDGKNDDSKGQVQYPISVGKCVVEAECQR